MRRMMQPRAAVIVVVLLGSLFGMVGGAQARWKVIADHAVDPVAVCRDGIIFAFSGEFYSEFADYSGYPAVRPATFKAAFPVPEEDIINGGYVYPAKETIIANHAFSTYKFAGSPWGIDTDDPPDGVDDSFLVYQGMSIVKWKQPLAPGSEVLLTFADFSSNEISPIETVGDCSVFTIDIRPGVTSNRVDFRTKSPLEVAVLKTPDFNPATIDRSSVRFGRTGYEAKPTTWVFKDADRDGDVDLVFKFTISSLKLRCGDTAGFLSAQTTNGPFFGGDTLVPTNCR